jgi:hypothetical protein
MLSISMQNLISSNVSKQYIIKVKDTKDEVGKIKHFAKTKANSKILEVGAENGFN